MAWSGVLGSIDALVADSSLAVAVGSSLAVAVGSSPAVVVGSSPAVAGVVEQVAEVVVVALVDSMVYGLAPLDVEAMLLFQLLETP